MARAKDVYAKLQNDLDSAKRERSILSGKIQQAQSAVASTDMVVSSHLANLLPWAEKLVPTMFSEKKRLDAEVLEIIATRERELYSLTKIYDEAIKIYSDLDAAHQSFKISEDRRLNSDAAYIAALNDIEGYDEAGTRTQIDELVSQVEKQNRKLEDNWLVKAAYHNKYGQKGYEPQHFLQDLFGMFCVRLKKTRRYLGLIRDVEYAKEMLAGALVKSEAKATIASNAGVFITHMREESRARIETDARKCAEQKTIVDAAEVAVKSEREALGSAKQRERAIKTWTHPTAIREKNDFFRTLIGDSHASENLRETLTSHNVPASIIAQMMKYLEKKSENILAISELEVQQKTLSVLIEKLESVSTDMRRKSLANSIREIEKADDFMAGNSTGDGFDFSTLVAVTVILNGVVDETPQDKSFTESWSSNDSFSTSSFD